MSHLEYQVDPDTGEITGVVEVGFRVDSEESARWVMEKINGLDAELAGIAKQRESILRNLDRMEKEVTSRRFALSKRFGAELEEFAKKSLPKGKRTWTCPYGSVAFRSQPARLRVVNEAEAIEWARLWAPSAVKREEEVKFLVSELSKEVVTDVVDGVRKAPGLAVVPAYESVQIDTGYKKDGNDPA